MRNIYSMNHLSFPRQRESSSFCHSRNKDGNPAQIYRDSWIPDSACGGSGMTILWSACILCIMFCLTSFALDAPERAFIWNEANAIMQNAKTPPEYLRAAQTYQRLIDDGVRNGPLFYNIGTALLLADRPELALDAFERAERYLGRQPDLERNLKIAFAKKAKSANAPLPWYRLAAFWHFYLSCPQRICIAVYAFLAFWLVLTLQYALRLTSWLTLQKMGINRATDPIAWFSFVVFIVFATSAAASWQMEASAGRYNLSVQPLMPPTNAPAASLPAKP